MGKHVVLALHLNRQGIRGLMKGQGKALRTGEIEVILSMVLGLIIVHMAYVSCFYPS